MPTPLLGRSAELAALRALLEKDRARLITLTGAGGSGKTRLAIEFGVELEARFDRIWFVDLTLVNRPDLVPSAIGQAIGIQEGGSGELDEILREMLSVGRFVLLLDNFEHVLDAATYVGNLLAACRGVVVVATTREALGIRAEHVFVVEPLAIPSRDQLDDPVALRQFPSVQLFEERARAANSNFELTDDTIATIAEICLDLDGLPLAIELVAAQARVLTPHDILSRLQARAPLVTAGPRDVPARHRTLEATVAWSYDLLTPAEQAVFRLCGVFAGGFTSAALQALAQAIDLDVDALFAVTQLVAKNLVRLSGESSGTSRFALLETIRTYALDRLRESGELAPAQRAQAQYYVDLAEQLQPAMRGPGMARALDTLATEYSNLRAVFQWSSAHRELELGLRLAGALYLFWNARGHVAEARAWLEPALAASDGVSTEVRAVAFNAAGVMAGMQHDHERAVAYFSESFALWTQLGKVDRQAGVALNLGLVAQNLRELERAEVQFERAYELYVQAGDRRGQANALGSRARVARDRGKLHLALDLLEQCLSLFRAVGDDWGIANCLANLGHVHLELEDAVASEAAFREALEVRRALGNLLHIAESLEGLAGVMARDRPRIAVRLLGAAKSMRDQSGAPVPAAEEARYADLVGRVRAGLTDTMFRAGWNAGRTLAVNSAVDLALSVEAGVKESPPPAPAGDLAGLSARELEIARMIARGYSNRAIAEALVISVKTVETHVKHIFVKLDVSSRASLAALASRADTP